MSPAAPGYLQESSQVLLTVAAAAIRAEPVASIAGTLVASGVIEAVLLTAVRAVVTFIDI